MKRFLGHLKIIFSAASIVVLIIASAMLLYSSVVASLEASGIITEDSEFPAMDAENKSTDQYKLHRIPDVKHIEYKLVELVEEPPVEEAEHNEAVDFLSEGYLSDEIPLSYDLQMTARDAAKRFDVPYALVIAMIWKESSFCETAYNAECYGLMQVASINFEWICKDLAVPLMILTLFRFMIPRRKSIRTPHCIRLSAKSRKALSRMDPVFSRRTAQI